jgi:hypothetical protein
MNHADGDSNKDLKIDPKKACSMVHGSVNAVVYEEGGEFFCADCGEMVEDETYSGTANDPSEASTTVDASEGESMERIDTGSMFDFGKHVGKNGEKCSCAFCAEYDTGVQMNTRSIPLPAASLSLQIHQRSPKCTAESVVWDAAIVLARYLARDLDLRKRFGTHPLVLDLGSGTGVVGLAAAALGARVVLTDLPEFLPLIELNVKENEHAMGSNVLGVHALRWGNYDDLERVRNAVRKHPLGAVMGSTEFDMVLMSDW